MQTQVRCGAILLALAAGCGQAQAWTGQVSWPTYYRAGPGLNYVVLDELDRGETLTVLSCKSGWCQAQLGGSTGYVEQAWIRPPSALPKNLPIAAPESCVQSIVTGSGYRDGLAYRFCSQNTQVIAPSGQPVPDSEGAGDK